MAAWVQEQRKSNSDASIEQISLHISGMIEKWKQTPREVPRPRPQVRVHKLARTRRDSWPTSSDSLAIGMPKNSARPCRTFDWLLSGLARSWALN